MNIVKKGGNKISTNLALGVVVLVLATSWLPLHVWVTGLMRKAGYKSQLIR